MNKKLLILIVIASCLIGCVRTESTTTSTEGTTTTANSATSCDNSPRAPFDCETSKDKCKIEKWKRVMTELCPKTCGLCTPSNCTDNTDCRGMKALCRDFEWVMIMRDNCALTCGYCNETGGSTGERPNGCVDTSPNCALNARYCNDPSFSDILGKSCARTCNRCGSSVACTDANNSCPQWAKRGFCTNNFYEEAYRRRMCAKTCNFC
uniref:ShKT domain-containing protein n=1 Tax=Steinernema glaseri TaxID=37863 RepID=A0A1I7ZYR2_9BILA